MWRRWPGKARTARRALAALAAALISQLAAVAETGQAMERADVVPIEVFVVREDGDPVVSRDWLNAQVFHASALFAPAGVGFEIERVRAISDEHAHIETRDDRDALAAIDREPGRVQLFVVRRLDDVDVDGNRLFGVHWRFREDRSQTWIIMSTRDTTNTVLAHELGHLFELGHSRYPASIMNKSPDVEVPWPARAFAEPETERIRRQARRHFASGRLAPAGQDGD